MERHRAEAKWTDKAHFALLLALTDALLAKGPLVSNKDVIMAALEERGLTFTWEAVRQHLQKLRRKEGAGPAGAAAAGSDSAGPSGSATATPKTPKTPGRKKTTVKKEPGSSTPSKRKSAATVNIDSDSDEDVKPKVKKQKEDDKVKKEEPEDDDYSAAYEA
ncbi:hypothetical protein VTK56DRAFT_555 [Thermocarpiscus australiensis]